MGLFQLHDEESERSIDRPREALAHFWDSGFTSLLRMHTSFFSSNPFSFFLVFWLQCGVALVDNP
jgi:hypothetical protein